MAVADRTSVILAQELARLDQEKVRPSRSNPIIRAIQDDVIGSAERLLSKAESLTAKLTRQNRAGTEWLLDDAFSRLFVEQVPQIVRRSARFDVTTSDRNVPLPVSGYLREASRAYVIGLNNAAVALCRAALEEGLKDCLPRIL